MRVITHPQLKVNQFLNTSASETQLLPDPTFPPNLHRWFVQEAALAAPATLSACFRSRAWPWTAALMVSAIKRQGHGPRGQVGGQEEYSHRKGANPGVMEGGDTEQPPGKCRELRERIGNWDLGKGTRKRKLISVLKDG